MSEVVMSLKNIVLAAGTIVVLILGITMNGSAGEKKSVYDFTMKAIDGKEVKLSQYKGKVLLLVNVASKCGYTPQYRDLEALFEKYKDKGFVILGFPANNFGSQEPGTDTEIQSFCGRRYGVTFDMFSKISVRGSDQAPLYKFITADTTVGGEVKWNFQKYLVDKHGKLTHKFLSQVGPLSEELVAAVEALLKYVQRSSEP